MKRPGRKEVEAARRVLGEELRKEYPGCEIRVRSSGRDLVCELVGPEGAFGVMGLRVLGWRRNGPGELLLDMSEEHQASVGVFEQMLEEVVAGNRRAEGRCGQLRDRPASEVRAESSSQERNT